MTSQSYPAISRTCPTCMLVLSGPRSLRSHLGHCLVEATSSLPDLRLPSNGNVQILRSVLLTYNSAHQRISILRASGTCVPGLYPLFFPTSSRSTPPILKDLGVSGKEDYQLLSQATHEGPVRLPRQLIIEKGILNS